MRRFPALAGAALLLVARAPAAPQSQEQVERLTALGQVWGFLKYFHPGVAAGTIHWDSVLVAAAPKVRAARTDAEFNATVQSLLDAAGAVRPCVDDAGNATAAGRCGSIAHDSLRKNLDLRWLSDSKTLSADITRRLAQVRDSRHQGSGRYVTFGNTAMFQADTAFNMPEYPSEGVRLLALFRFWNAARYYFPYMYVNGGDWNAVLPEFIPRLIAAGNAEEYHLTLLEMTTRLHDAHVAAISEPIASALGARPPAFEARSIEGQIVVWSLRGAQSDRGGLRVGDVITHIDGEAVAQRRTALAKYVAAGNPAVFERKLVATVLRGRADSATYTIVRDGRSLNRRVAMAPAITGASAPARPGYPVAELAKVLPGTDIGYINMGDINLPQVDSALAIVRNTSGIVMDVRNYPRSTMYRFAEFFNPDARPFVKFTVVDSTHPGQVVWTSHFMAGRAGGNAGHYRGRVAILVDERTQSHAEFSVMALRTAPDNKVIGSQTAGADGNVTALLLPGGVRTVFTGLGVYYPDGAATQRIGIVPDIEIRPTMEGLRAGRDEVLERALEYIRTGR
ncbi:MAG TPA: S41 family peptidase [Gemmatimonadaceae bacterium]|nr:S41 family peptidase [Gemmatimonadaceae bacterium]